MQRRAVLRIVAAGILGGVALGGCAAGTAVRRDPNVLTRDEISSITVTNLYDAVDRLRPRWLEVRGPRSVNTGTVIAVFLNRTYLGDIEVLRTYDVRAFPRLRYLDGPTAAATLTGYDTSRHLEGAIVLETTPGGV